MLTEGEKVVFVITTFTCPRRVEKEVPISTRVVLHVVLAANPVSKQKGLRDRSSSNELILTGDQLAQSFR